MHITHGFNPVLGFLSVSTHLPKRIRAIKNEFQSRAGFSECLDIRELDEQQSVVEVSIPCWVF